MRTPARSLAILGLMLLAALSAIPCRGAEAIATPAPGGQRTIVVQGRSITLSVYLGLNLMPPAAAGRPVFVSVTLHTDDPRGLPVGLHADHAEFRIGEARLRMGLRDILPFASPPAWSGLPPPDTRYDPGTAVFWGTARWMGRREDAGTLIRICLSDGRRSLNVTLPVQVSVAR